MMHMPDKVKMAYEVDPLSFYRLWKDSAQTDLYLIKRLSDKEIQCFENLSEALRIKKDYFMDLYQKHKIAPRFEGRTRDLIARITDDIQKLEYMIAWQKQLNYIDSLQEER